DEGRPVVLDHLLDGPADDAEQLVLGVIEPGQDARVVHQAERVGLAPVDGDLLPVHGHGGALQFRQDYPRRRARDTIGPRMHTLASLQPAHFHAALTLREPHPGAADEIVVYATDGPDLRDFLTLVGRFNGRVERPTRWRPLVVTCDDPLDRLIAER